MVSPTLKPVGRALAEFVPLKPAEQMLLEACRKGEYTSISEQCPEQADEQNMVRASFLRFLALGGDEHAPVHEKGVQLCGASVDGVLDLEGATLPHSLSLKSCHLNTVPILRDSNVLGFVSFNGCYVEGLEADGMVCSGSLSLEGSFITTVYLSGAEISGDLACTGGKFDGADYALLCQSTVIKGNVFLNNATATGSVSLIGTQIRGSLVCTNAVFGNTCSDKKHVNALNCDRAVIKGGVFLNTDFIATGTVRFSNAQIDSDLTCVGGKFDGKDGGDALLCQSTVITGNVFLNNATAIGTVRLVGAQIGGSLECTNAKFNDLRSDNQHVGALACDRAVIKGGVFLNTDFTATGTVSLSSAQISGSLDCTKASFNGTNGYALFAEGMVVAGGFFFRELSLANGTVSLVSAQVSSLIDDDQSWKQVELFLDGFIYDRLTGEAPMNAKSRLAWLDMQPESHSGLAGDGSDFKPQPWRQLQKVLHDMGHVEDARQVAIAFEDRLRVANLIGQTSKKWSKSRAWTYQKICRGFHRLFGWLIGYGYRPFRLFFKMVVVWLACGMFYWEAALYANNGNGVFAPSNPLVFQNSDYDVCKADKDASKFELHELDCRLPSTQGAGNWYLCGKLREEYTGFSPFLYSLDLILPLVDLQQEHDWAPMIPTPQNTWANELSNLINLKHWTRLVMWFEILFGWMSSLLLVAVVSGLTKRREE